VIKAVYDTNVIVSGLLNLEGIPAFLLDIATQRGIRLIISPEILQEYEGVLLRPKFGFSKRLVKKFLRLIKTKSKFVKPKSLEFTLKDPADNKFLECALAGKVDCLVTGNTRHFLPTYKGIRIISQGNFGRYIRRVCGNP
jgi:putative PIN family toxin of toxin-antitoxin system